MKLYTNVEQELTGSEQDIISSALDAYAEKVDNLKKPQRLAFYEATKKLGYGFDCEDLGLSEKDVREHENKNQPVYNKIKGLKVNPTLGTYQTKVTENYQSLLDYLNAKNLFDIFYKVADGCFQNADSAKDYLESQIKKQVRGNIFDYLPWESQELSNIIDNGDSDAYYLDPYKHVKVIDANTFNAIINDILMDLKLD